MLSPTCTDAIPQQYCGYPSAVLNSLHSTDAIPHMYCSYPFTVLNSLRSTADIPPQCWCYPPAVLMLFPQYWCYPPHVLILSPHSTEQLPQYWTASAVLNRRYTGWSGHNKLADCIEIGNGKSSIKKRIFYRGSESFPVSFVRSSESFHSGNFLINMDFWFCWKSS